MNTINQKNMQEKMDKLNDLTKDTNDQVTKIGDMNLEKVIE